MAASSQFRLASASIALITLVGACKKGGAGSDTSKIAQSGGAVDSTPSTSPPIALPVTVESARDGDLVLSVMTKGQVRSMREAKLKTEVAGTVTRVLVRPGQSVRRGQALVLLDTIPFALQLRAKQIEVDRARLAFLDLWVPDSLAGLRAGAEDRRRVFATRSGFDAAVVAYEQAKIDRERATVVAPFDGVVDRLDVSEGERLGSGQQVAVVVDMKNLRIEAAVLQHDIPIIKEGGIASVSSSASPNVLGRGQIEAVLPIVDSVSKAGRAYVRLTDNGVLRPGMTVDLRLEAHRLKNVRLVPKQAVIERDGRPVIFVVRGNRAEWTYINRGRDNGVETEIKPDTSTNEIPVKVGEPVIIRGHLTLTHQAQVRVIKKAETP